MRLGRPMDRQQVKARFDRWHGLENGHLSISFSATFAKSPVRNRLKRLFSRLPNLPDLARIPAVLFGEQCGIVEGWTMRPRLFVCGLLVVLLWGNIAVAQSRSSSTGYRIWNLRQSSSISNVGDEERELRFADYEERLNAVLKTRRDEEKKFVKDVLRLVKDGELPEHLIETSYKWVVNKRPDSDYPFIYFERVLRIQAGLLELTIPEFDYSIYDHKVFRSGGNGKRDQ